MHQLAGGGQVSYTFTSRITCKKKGGVLDSIEIATILGITEVIQEEFDKKYHRYIVPDSSPFIIH